MKKYELALDEDNIKETIERNTLGRKIKHIDLYHLFMNNRGKDIIREFLASCDKETLTWIKELTGNNENNQVDFIIKCYEEIFKNTNSIFRINFHEAISLLGDRIRIEEKQE